MNNLVCKWIRRGVVTLAEGESIRTELRHQNIEYHAFGPLTDPAFGIANQTGRALYDCLYIALAVHLKGLVVTADRRLCDALADGPFAGHVLWIGEIG